MIANIQNHKQNYHCPNGDAQRYNLLFVFDRVYSILIGDTLH